jgi:hypothetical protein
VGKHRASGQRKEVLTVDTAYNRPK